MRRSLWAVVIVLVLAAIAAPKARADGTSYVGTLANPDSSDLTMSTFQATLVLTTASDVTLQTYGFGGGTNQAGTLIGPGGTDPFVGLFSGTGNTAAFINGTSLDLTNYSPGCPPANTVSDFGGTTCGDVTLRFDDLLAGTYTVLLSDGQFIPNAAVGFGSTLGDGFLDLTGGSNNGTGFFCNILDVTSTVNCPNPTGAYALDVLTAPLTATAPEPASLALLGSGLLVIAGFHRHRRGR
jgi:hypothetical protein